MVSPAPLPPPPPLPAPPKPQWQTGHFWLMVAAFIIGSVLASGALPSSSKVYGALTTLSFILAAAGYQYAYKAPPPPPSS